MHELASPHCSHCKHFVSCFQTDLAVEWGYCSRNKIPPLEELARIKRRVESGEDPDLLSRAQELGLFMPANTRCDLFADLYPF